MDSNPSIEIVDAEATKTSFVWQYFGFLKINGEVDKQSAACKICKNVTKYSGNTTNLSFHLRRYHGVTPPLVSGQGPAQRSSQDLHSEGFNPDQEDLFKQNFLVSIPCRLVSRKIDLCHVLMSLNISAYQTLSRTPQT